MDAKLVARPDFGSHDHHVEHGEHGEHGEIDAEAEAFFRRPSRAPLSLVVTDPSAHFEYDYEDDDTLPPPLETGSRRAMHATLGILAFSVIALGSFLIYSKVLMPTPVELGTSASLVAPVALIAPSTASAQPSAATPPFADAPVMHVSPSHTPALTPAATEATPPAAVAEQAARPATAPIMHATPSKKARVVSGPSSAAPSRAAAPEDALVKRAFRSLNSGRLEAAIADARRALDSTPNRADAWLVLGSAYDALHDHHSALLAFRACTARASGPFLSECQKLAR